MLFCVGDRSGMITQRETGPCLLPTDQTDQSELTFKNVGLHLHKLATKTKIGSGGVVRLELTNTDWASRGHQNSVYFSFVVFHLKSSCLLQG